MDRARRQCVLNFSPEFLDVVGGSPAGTSERKRGADNNREVYFFGEPQRLIDRADETAARRFEADLAHCFLE